MSRREQNSRSSAGKVARQRDPIPWQYCFLALLCGLLLAVGFFWAARQHFAAMDLGIRNAKLRQTRDGLESEQRRLFLSREKAMSPLELQKTAQKIGLQEIDLNDIQVVATPSAQPSSESPAPTKAAVSNPPASNPEEKAVSRVKPKGEPVVKEQPGKTVVLKPEVATVKEAKPAAVTGTVTKPKIGKDGTRQ